MKSSVRLKLGLFLASLMLASCSGKIESGTMNSLVTAEEAYSLMTQPVPPLPIDVRMTFEYKTERLDGAIHIPVQRFLTGSYRDVMENISKHRPLLVYCRHGVRSSYARKVLVKHGYSKVFDLRGGTVAWKKAGLPMVDGVDRKEDTYRAGEGTQ
jgi:rhodanese-related sulfurtransferase